MKYPLFAFWLILSTFTSFAQSNDTWTAFLNSDSTLTGFKDDKGQVKIEPRFMENTYAQKFTDIIAVMEDGGKPFITYYFTKSGKIIGRDSLYTFDNTPDCECEGFIRFTDRKTDQTGIFRGDGTIAIPAAYSTVSNVQNGMISVLQGAKKDRLSATDEHWFWTGGKQMLIDLNNNVLIDNFKSNDLLDFYSVSITDQPQESPIRQQFKGTNGKYYSFIDTDKEFAAWLKKLLTGNFTKEQLLLVTYPEVLIYEEPEGWLTIGKQKFTDASYSLIKTKLGGIYQPKAEYHVFTDGLNPFLYDSPSFETFYDNCGQAKEWKYPIKTVVVNRDGKDGLAQDHFAFLRTDSGYKMISMTLGE